MGAVADSQLSWDCMGGCTSAGTGRHAQLSWDSLRGCTMQAEAAVLSCPGIAWEAAQMQAEAAVLSCPGRAWKAAQKQAKAPMLRQSLWTCTQTLLPGLDVGMGITKTAHPQRLHGLHRVGERVRRLTQHMRMPAALHYRPVRLRGEPIHYPERRRNPENGQSEAGPGAEDPSTSNFNHSSARRGMHLSGL